MSSIDDKNIEVLMKLVSERFGLSKRSIERFNKAITGEERELAPEYMSLIKDAKDLRVRFPVPISMNEANDDGWKLFKSAFNKFYSSNKIKYEDYYNNRAEDDGQVKKLSKIVSSWYKENTIAFFEDMFRFDARMLENYIETNKKFSKKEIFESLLDKPGNIEAACIKATIRGMVIRKETGKYKLRVSIERNGKAFSLYIDFVTISKAPFMEEFVALFVNRVNERVGAVGIPKTSGLQVVLSLNIADWFLCSTAERWSSCLNLNSDYGSCYWAGLPGLIVDTNRAMVYITDGRKKTAYGITVDRVMSRAWLLLTNEGLHFVNEYPGTFSLRNLCGKIFEGTALGKGVPPGQGFYSKYSFEPLYHSKGNGKYYATSIFLDTTRLIVDSKNTVKHEYGGRGRANPGFKSVSEKAYTLKQNFDDDPLCYGGTLEDLIENEESLSDHIH